MFFLLEALVNSISRLENKSPNSKMAAPEELNQS